MTASQDLRLTPVALLWSSFPSMSGGESPAVFRMRALSARLRHTNVSTLGLEAVRYNAPTSPPAARLSGGGPG